MYILEKEKHEGPSNGSTSKRPVIRKGKLLSISQEEELLILQRGKAENL